MASSSLALTALNFKPYPKIKTAAAALPSISVWKSERRPGKVVRACGEMRKMYKGTAMRVERLTEMIEQKVMEARQVCGEDEISEECRVAWDEVEEVSQAKADLRLKIHHLKQDPLEHFCQENPDTDECRIYED